MLQSALRSVLVYKLRFARLVRIPNAHVATFIDLETYSHSTCAANDRLMVTFICRRSGMFQAQWLISSSAETSYTRILGSILAIPLAISLFAEQEASDDQFISRGVRYPCGECLQVYSYVRTTHISRPLCACTIHNARLLIVGDIARTIIIAIYIPANPDPRYAQIHA